MSTSCDSSAKERGGREGGEGGGGGNGEGKKQRGRERRRNSDGVWVYLSLHQSTREAECYDQYNTNIT